MKAFRFSLQALKTLRLRDEQRALEVHARSLQAHESARRELRSAQDSLQQAWHEWNQRVAVGGESRSLGQCRAHCLDLEQRVAACQARLMEAETVMKESLALWMAARQRREIVEKLETRQRHGHDRRLRAEEQKLLDEMAIRPRNDGSEADDVSPHDHVWN